VIVNAVSFAALHLPAALNDQDPVNELLHDLCLGLALCLVRLWSGNVTLAVLLHAAWDISGGF
jgi:membrane protease YdiL (CAAX protease family)